MPNVGSILEHVPGVYVDDIPVELTGTVGTFTNNTIALGPSASSTSNYYVGHFVFVQGTEGYDPDIISYDGTTKVATIKGWGQSVSTSTVSQWSAGNPTIGATWKLINRYPVQKRHQWVKNGVDIPGAIGLSYTPSTSGNYQVRETAFFVDNNLVEQERSVNLTAPISITGTRDPALVYWDNLEYLGCFTTPGYNGGNNDDLSYSGPMAFNPDGNGGQGSLFIRGHVYRNLVAEISIPPQNTWATNSSAAIPAGTMLSGQTYDPLEGQLGSSGITSGGGVYIGGLHVYNGKLIVTAHGDYSVGNSAAWFWQRPLNLATVGQVQGPFSVSDRLTSDTYPRNNTRCFAGYMATVPTELQSKLGGPVIAGLSAQSIVSNTSDGPAISGFNPADFSLNAARRGVVTVASQTTLTLDASASNVANFYLNWAAVCTHGPNASRTSTGRVTAYDPLNKIVTVTGWAAAPLAGDTWIVIPPVTAKAMSMYGTGQLQDGTATTYNGITFNGYQGIFNWTGRRMGGAVVPNGTRSVLVFGKAGNGPYLYTVSNRTKQGYKYFSGYSDTDTGGEKAYPYYNRCWAYDANELEQARLGNILPWNVKPYAVMNFVFPFAGSQTFSDIAGVTIDPATGRIFLSTQGLPYGNTAIHVYRVNNSTVATAPTVNAASVVANTMSLSLPAGTATDYPYQFGRVFKQGVIANFPQVLIDGVAQTTQADVKNRWPDGSVKFAVLSLVVPSLSTSEKTLTFQNQASGNNTPETKANMLANYDFNCTINATSGGTPITGAPVSARTILNAVSDATLASNTSGDSPNSRYWTQGPICTTVILCDHTSKTYDFGTTADKSLRPVFHVQFWPTLNKYKVRAIVEQSDVTKIQTQTYDVSVTNGNASPTTVYTKSSVTHIYGGRWTKTAWSGTAPASVNIDHNSTYLSSTLFIPNYDPAVKLTGTKITDIVARWAAAPKGIFESGEESGPKSVGWRKDMPYAGGRPEIALLPNWNVDAILSDDYRLQDIAYQLTELALSWPMNQREGVNTKYYDAAQTIPALGFPVSLYARPTMFYFDNGYMDSTVGVDVQDRFTWISGTTSASRDGWNPDGAHQPSPFYIPYLTSGEYLWLEQMQFWASWGAFNPQNNTTSGFYGRGPTLSSGALNGAVRRRAWCLRSRAQAAALSVDNSKEKAYYTALLNDAIAIEEGIHGVTGSAFQGNAAYQWGVTVGRPDGQIYKGFGVHPIGNWDNGVVYASNYYANWTAGINYAYAPWLQYYMIIALSHVKDLGFPVSELRAFSARFITDCATNNQNAPLLGLFVVPSTYGSASPDVTTGQLPSWDAVFAAYLDPNKPKEMADSTINSFDEPNSSGLAAAATIADLPNGLVSYNWMKTNWADNRTTFAYYYPWVSRWSIIPRT